MLSKPLRRPAFILAKLIAHGLGLLATWVVLPGAVVAYLEFAILGKLYLPMAGFAGMLGLMYLNLLFYLALVLMLATLFQGRGPVLGIPLIVVWGWMITPLGVALADVMPWRLLIDLGQNEAIPALGWVPVAGCPAAYGGPDHRHRCVVCAVHRRRHLAHSAGGILAGQRSNLCMKGVF